MKQSKFYIQVMGICFHQFNTGFKTIALKGVSILGKVDGGLFSEHLADKLLESILGDVENDVKNIKSIIKNAPRLK